MTPQERQPTGLHTGTRNRPILTPEQERARFVELFPVSLETHLEGISKFMGRVVGGYKKYEWSDRPFPVNKYSEDQVKNQEWDESDLADAIEHVRKEEATRRYFRNASDEFHNLHARRESVIRLDQEQAIVDDLENGIPVLIRGNWRIGKSSMGLRLMDRVGAGNAIYFDVGGYAGLEEHGPEKFKARFGLNDVSNFVLDKELEGQEVDFKTRWSRRDQLIDEIGTSGYHPFAYLDQWLGKKGETAYVGLDEVIYYADKPELLQYVADLRHHKNLKVAVVLHHIARFEDSMRQTFAGYNSHYIRRITTPEAHAMIDHGLQGTEIQFTDEAVDELMKFSGGRPMEINYVLADLLYPYSDDYEPKLVYRVDDIKSITDRDTWDLPSQFRSVAIDTYERVYQLAMTDEQRKIIDSLHAKRKRKYRVGSIDPNVVQPLLDTNVLVEDDETGTYQINGSLFVRAMQEMKANEKANRLNKLGRSYRG